MRRADPRPIGPRVAFAAALLLVAAGLPGTARAWDEHALLSWVALRGDPALDGAAKVPAEPFDDFVAKEQAGLAAVLRDSDDWARRHVPTWPPPPAAIVFTPRPGAPPAEIRKRFLEGARINPDALLALFVQVPPGQPRDGRPPLPAAAVTLLPDMVKLANPPFAALRPGEPVSPLLVLESASDEPDYGLDVGLYEDNGTAYGRRAGLGKQPFGNPRLSFGSQAPFHMGFFHETRLLYAAAGFLERTWPEVRVHQYTALARFAFRTGHPYWGYRFLGWACHYVQDLTQPYHSTVFPGRGTLSLMWIDGLDLLGFHGRRTRAVTLLSNRHLALEDFELRTVAAALRKGAAASAEERAVLASLGDRAADGRYPAWDEKQLRKIVSRESHDRAAEVDATLLAVAPARLVDDPGYALTGGKGDPDVRAAVAAKSQAGVGRLSSLLAELLHATGIHTRRLVESVVPR